MDMRRVDGERLKTLWSLKSNFVTVLVEGSGTLVELKGVPISVVTTIVVAPTIVLTGSSVSKKVEEEPQCNKFK